MASLSLTRQNVHRKSLICSCLLDFWIKYYTKQKTVSKFGSMEMIKQYNYAYSNESALIVRLFHL